MNLQEYEREHQYRYSEFSEIVKLILERAIAATDCPRPQSVQHRAKSVSSLRDRLEEQGNLDSDTIELDRRDLAGARLIFYTNTDVNRFLNSGIVFENFDVERESTRVHLPTAENQQRRYRAIHYTVSLKDDRIKLAEYSKFKSLRCEIQVQTILNHAWSETSHDIAYKNKFSDGFGSRAMASIKERFDRIMDKYLLPAGYEFQRVQHDYERLRQGKELFDKDILDSIARAQDNNERADFLTSLKDQVIPNYDDIPGVFSDLVQPLISVAKAARDTPTKQIETPFGDIEGKTAEDVVELVVEIFDQLRYVDVETVFDAYCDLYKDEKSERVRKRILSAVEQLARYDAAVWKQAGAFIQDKLVDKASSINVEDERALHPIIVSVLESALSGEISGETWKPNSVTLSTASVPVSAVRGIRDRAIDALFSLFTRSGSDDERRPIILALREATRGSGRARYSNELVKQTLIDAARIVGFFTESAESLSYELRESMEHGYLFSYYRARELLNAKDDKLKVREEAKALVNGIEAFRDRINADSDYVRYKTLVGFETVLPAHWTDESRDFRIVEEFRQAEAKRFVAEMSSENSAYWFPFIERCAATKSEDLATFPIFGGFLNELAEKRPLLAKALLGRGDENLLRFMPAFLNGLIRSGSRQTYEEIIQSNIDSGRYLAATMMHWRHAKPDNQERLDSILDKAIEIGDDVAVYQSVLFALEAGKGDSVPPCNAFFPRAISYLSSKKDATWSHGAYFANDAAPFFQNLSETNAKLLLNNLVEAPRVEHPVERILDRVASKYLALVWDYFEQRLVRSKESTKPDRYEAVPYEFHGLEKSLSADIYLAISKVRAWYKADDYMFRFLGGKLLSIAFPKVSPEFSSELVALVENGDSDDADFAVAILENYHGEDTTHDILKAIVAKFPTDESKLVGVSISFDSTGVVVGEFGYADALREKKSAIEPWLDDQRAEVRDFAQKHIRSLEIRIADEQGRAETRKALRALDYDDDGIDKSNPENKP